MPRPRKCRQVCRLPQHDAFEPVGCGRSAEAVVITALFGYIGMCAGVGVMEAVNQYLISSAAEADPSDMFSSISFFKDPTLDISIVASATVVLMVAGVVAGYIPARRAARVKTIDALRDSL